LGFLRGIGGDEQWIGGGEQWIGGGVPWRLVLGCFLLHW